MNEANGNCFEVTAHVILGTPPTIDESDQVSYEDYFQCTNNLKKLKAKSIRLVHGIVERKTDGRKHCHAWIECTLVQIAGHKGRYCFDFANGLRVMLPKEAYYGLGNIKDVTRYTKNRTKELLVFWEHYGPFDYPVEEWS